MSGKMDGLQLVSPSSMNSFQVDQWKAPKGGPSCDVTYSVKSLTGHFPGSDVWRHSQNRTYSNKMTKLNKFFRNSSSHNFATYSNSSDMILHNSDPLKSPFIVNEKSKVDKGVTRNLRKKARKKGKQKSKLSPTTVFVGPEVFSEDCRHCCSASVSSGNNDIDHSDGLVSYATSQDDSFSEGRGNTVSSESPKTSHSYTDERDGLEVKEPSTVEASRGKNSVISSDVSINMEARRFFINDGRLEAQTNIQNPDYGTVNFTEYYDIYNSQCLDSTSVLLNSDMSTSISSDAKPCRKANNSVILSEAQGFNSKSGRFSLPNSFGGVNLCDRAEESRYKNQGLNSAGMQLVPTGKKGKHAKPMLRGLSAYKYGTASTSLGRNGKENYHSFWQRVEKKDVNQSNSELLKEAGVVCSQPYVTSKDAFSLIRNSNDATVNIFSKSEDHNQSKVKVSRRSKRKTSLGSKKEYSYTSRKGLYPSKVCSGGHTEIGTCRDEMLDYTKLVNEQKRSHDILRSGSHITALELGFHSSHTKTLNSESLHSSKDCRHIIESQEIDCNTLSIVEIHNKVKSLARSSSPSDRMKMRDVGNSIYLPHLLFNEASQRENDVPVAELSKQNQSSGSFSQKWIPRGTKDPQSTTSARYCSFSIGPCDQQGVESWTLRNNTNKKTDSQSFVNVAPPNVRMRNMALASEIMTSTGEDTGSQTIVETESSRIALAVNEASKVQLASDAVWMANGSPIAEFERLLHFSSPVICQSLNLISCNGCSLDQVGSALCRHETPNIPLGCLWQWYEKHGSFGLEIKAEDVEQTKRLGVDRFSFRAYFVPLLSAIQLFRNSECHSAETRDGNLSPGIAEAKSSSENWRSIASVGHLPQYSLPVPEPQSMASVKNKEEYSFPAVDITCSSYPELLFEYFETEQPRHRRPLYEK